MLDSDGRNSCDSVQCKPGPQPLTAKLEWEETDKYCLFSEEAFEGRTGSVTQLRLYTGLLISSIMLFPLYHRDKTQKHLL